MPEIFIGRQPIFDRHLRVYGYELLYRHADVDCAMITNCETASTEVIFNSLLEIGLDRLVGGHKAFCNFSRDFLVNRSDFSLIGSRVVIEVLETVQPEPEVLEVLRSLSRKGHVIALDDFVLSDESAALVKVADIIKIDVMAQPREHIVEQMGRLRKIKPLKFLAEKVESHDDFVFCSHLGFDYYQGYFFSKPQIVAGRQMPPGRMAMLRLLSELHQGDVSLEKIQKLIETDVHLSIKLLRLINSSFYSPASKVKSIRHAIVYLGLYNIRNWACLLTIGSVDDKPRELMTMSLVRAKMCELLSGTEDKENQGMFFTIGLFSLLDVIFDTPLESLLEYLPLAEEVNEALLNHRGPGGEALRCIEAHERGDWDFIENSRFDNRLVSVSFLKALDWSEAVMKI